MIVEIREPKAWAKLNEDGTPKYSRTIFEGDCDALATEITAIEAEHDNALKEIAVMTEIILKLYENNVHVGYAKIEIHNNQFLTSFWKHGDLGMLNHCPLFDRFELLNDLKEVKS